VSGRIGSISSKAGQPWCASATTPRTSAPRHHQPDRPDLRELRRAPGPSCPTLRAAMAQGAKSRSTAHRRRHTRKQPGAIAFIENNVDPNTGHGDRQGRRILPTPPKVCGPGQFVQGSEVILGRSSRRRSRWPAASRCSSAPQGVPTLFRSQGWRGRAQAGRRQAQPRSANR